jgi:hypothetical protein
MLSEYGAAPAHTLRADEALPWGVIAIGGAALLRYSPSASA